MRREVYSGWLKLLGEEHRNTLRETNNYAVSLSHLQRYQESKSLLRRTLPVARRALGDSDETTLRMKLIYTAALCNDEGATLDDLREAVTTLEPAERTARRVLGGAHPITGSVQSSLVRSREILASRETPPTSA